jgi:hypothetical protein
MVGGGGGWFWFSTMDRLRSTLTMWTSRNAPRKTFFSFFDYRTGPERQTMTKFPLSRKHDRRERDTKSAGQQNPQIPGFLCDVFS